MPLTQLATVKRYLDKTDTADDTLLNELITRASEAIERLCNRTLGIATYTSRQLNGSGDVYLLLPNFPIASITALKVDKTTIAAAVNYDDDGYLITVPLAGEIYYVGGFARGVFNVEITYRAGYVLPGGTPGAGETALPTDIEQACIELVTHWFEHRDGAGIKGESEGGARFDYYDGGIPDPIREKLLPYRRPPGAQTIR